MTPFDLKRQLAAYTVAHSGHEPHRDYLGMSQIGRREDDLIREMTTGEQWRPTDDEHAALYLGRAFEADVQARLDGLGLLVRGTPGLELAAAFDDRFRGHIDGLIRTDRGEALVEIKSVAGAVFERVQRERAARPKDFHQVQCYLRHAAGSACQCPGGLRQGFVVYLSRESGLFYVVEVTAHGPTQDALDAKARRVLAAVDAQRQAAA